MRAIYRDGSLFLPKEIEIALNIKDRDFVDFRIRKGLVEISKCQEDDTQKQMFRLMDCLLRDSKMVGIITYNKSKYEDSLFDWLDHMDVKSAALNGEGLKELANGLRNRNVKVNELEHSSVDVVLSAGNTLFGERKIFHKRMEELTKGQVPTIILLKVSKTDEVSGLLFSERTGFLPPYLVHMKNNRIITISNIRLNSRNEIETHLIAG